MHLTMPQTNPRSYDHTGCPTTEDHRSGSLLLLSERLNADLEARLGSWIGDPVQFLQRWGRDGFALKVPLLAEAIESAGPIATNEARQLYHLRDGLWLPDGRREVLNRARLLLVNHFKVRRISPVVQWFQDRTPTLTDLDVVP